MLFIWKKNPDDLKTSLGWEYQGNRILSELLECGVFLHCISWRNFIARECGFFSRFKTEVSFVLLKKVWAMRTVYYHWIPLFCRIWNRSEVSPTVSSFVALDKPYCCTWVFHAWKLSSLRWCGILSPWEVFYRSDHQWTEHFNMGATASVPMESCGVGSGVEYSCPLCLPSLFHFESSSVCLFRYLFWASRVRDIWEYLKNQSLNFCSLVAIC